MSENGSERVSLEKSATTADAPAAATPPQRPKQVGWVVAALLACGLLALGASLSLFALHSFIVTQFERSNRKLKASDRRTHHELLQAAHQQPIAVLVQSAIFLIVLAFVARAVWRGRYWSRWAVIGVWILATFTGIFGGAPGVLYVAQSAPLALKLPVTLASVAFIAAVAIVVFVKPVPAWLNLTRPDRSAAGASGRRGGLLSQRDPVRSARQGISTASPLGSRKVREAAARTEDLFQGDSNTERARAKQRANTETMQRGAAEARARARDARGRGSKSRRNGS